MQNTFVKNVLSPLTCHFSCILAREYRLAATVDNSGRSIVDGLLHNGNRGLAAAADNSGRRIVDRLLHDGNHGNFFGRRISG